MAVANKKADCGQNASSRRRLYGANVTITVVLVAAIVGLLQYFAFAGGSRWDMTSSGINSLAAGTENLIANLDQSVRLTSLYFETDREEEDQQRYRRAVMDLLNLYEATNRASVTAEWINPLKDHEQLKRMKSRVRSLPAFADEVKTYRERIERFLADEGGIAQQARERVDLELEMINNLEPRMSDATVEQVVGPIKRLFASWETGLEDAALTVGSLSEDGNPQYAPAINEIRGIYRNLKESLSNIIKHATREVQRNPEMPVEVVAYLNGCAERYADLTATLTEEQENLDNLEAMRLDSLMAQLDELSNAILVETDKDARVVDFTSVWPAKNPQQAGMNVGFDQRMFKGESKVTAAILRLTSEKQPAVMFVRYGGQPLFTGGGGHPMMPQQSGPYMVMRQQLQDANFTVHEWDLKTSDTPPDIDPEPARVVYIILKPSPPPRDPMGRPSQEPPFSDQHREIVLETLGEDGRALFIAGWAGGPMGAVPAGYEYNTHLEESWGIKVDTSALLLHVFSPEPGKFMMGQDAPMLTHRELEVTEHEILSGRASRWTLPLCAPLEFTEEVPEGVTRHPLITQPRSDDVWAVHDFTVYEAQFREKGHVTRDEADETGPFTLAAAAERGDAKVVVVSSSEFASDRVAFARELSLSSTGLNVLMRNPGNVTLLINSLHWLNDNTDLLDVGRPIDMSVLEINKPAQQKTVQVVTAAVWPAIALLFGGVMWMVRRK